MRRQLICEVSGHAVSDHFADVSDMLVVGSGARQVEDVHLSRYCSRCASASSPRAMKAITVSKIASGIAGGGSQNLHSKLKLEYC